MDRGSAGVGFPAAEWAEAEGGAGDPMNPMALFVLLLVLSAMGALMWRRWNGRLIRGLAKVDEAWQELERALAERVAALEEMHAALERAGYVPGGRPRLLQAVASLRGAEGPRARAEADLAVEAVLHAIYRALPRERIEAIRTAQNRLAQADEERDIARTRYNDLSLGWILVARRFPYRHIAVYRRLVPREPFLLPGDDADYALRHLSRA